MKRLTTKDKILVSKVLITVIDNVVNGQNSADLTTDESLIFTFKKEDLFRLEAIHSSILDDLIKIYGK